MKKGLKIFLIIVIVVVVLVIGAIVGLKSWYNNNLKTVNLEANGKKISVEIKSGTGTKGIAELLANNNVIKDAKAFEIYVKLNKVNNLQAGKYTFNNGKDDVKSIVERISKGEVDDESIKLTFVEGKTIKDYAKLIAKYTTNTEDDVLNLVGDEEYIDSLIEKYWFITDEIKDKDIYYPLEGYLKPDTYTFENRNVSVEYIFSFILNYTDKFLSKYKDEIESSGLSVHQVLTIASVIEKEASNTSDMPGIAGVFYNRLRANMSLGSDVTTYYAFQVDLAESDLTSKQINTYNPYNTRGPNMNGKIPIGPICSPSEEAIKATLEPEQSDYYYFVSDKTGKTYFTKNYTEHQELVKKLKDEGLWYTYDK